MSKFPSSFVQTGDMQLKNRRWYEWILIALGILMIAAQLVEMWRALSPEEDDFNWLQLVGGIIFLWAGTVPRKHKGGPPV